MAHGYRCYRRLPPVLGRTESYSEHHNLTNVSSNIPTERAVWGVQHSRNPKEDFTFYGPMDILRKYITLHHFTVRKTPYSTDTELFDIFIWEWRSCCAPPGGGDLMLMTPIGIPRKNQKHLVANPKTPHSSACRRVGNCIIDILSGLPCREQLYLEAPGQVRWGHLLHWADDRYSLWDEWRPHCDHSRPFWCRRAWSEFPFAWAIPHTPAEDAPKDLCGSRRACAPCDQSVERYISGIRKRVMTLENIWP